MLVLTLLLLGAPVPQSHSCADGTTLAYTVTLPQQANDGDAPATGYPLVLCLHGMGGGTQAARVLARQQPEPCFVFTPKIDVKQYSWAGRRTKAMPHVLEALDAFIASHRNDPHHRVDPNRLYVTGQSMGGQGTWGALGARPDFFAAAVPVCGGWTPSNASHISHVPVWVFHGADDKTVPVGHSREMVAALQKAGGTPKYTEYEGVGHNAWTPTYNTGAMWTWLFAQRRPTTQKPSAPTAPQSIPTKASPDTPVPPSPTPTLPTKISPTINN